MSRMRLVKILFFCVCFLALCSVGLAKNVIANGTGTTLDEAERDALRNAVEDAVGILVDGETLVSKNVIVEDEIYLRSKGFVNNYQVLQQQRRGRGWQVTVEADIATESESLLMQELTRLGLIEKVLKNPRIAIIVPEKHNYHYYQPEGLAGETAIIQSFLAAGFDNLVEVDPARFQYNQPYELNEIELSNLAKSLQTDILIVGRAISDYAGDAGEYLPKKDYRHSRTNLLSCRARMEVRMYYARTGQIIAANCTFGSGVDVSEAVAAQKALNQAGTVMGDYLVDRLMAKAASQQLQLQVVALTADFTKLNGLKQALLAVPGVKNAQLTSYSDGRVSFTVNYSGTTQALFNKLQESADDELILHSLTYNILTIIIK